MDSLTMNIDLAKGGDGEGVVTKEATSSHPKKLEDHSLKGELSREAEKLRDMEVDAAAAGSKAEYAHTDDHKAQDKSVHHDGAKADYKKH